MKQLKRKSHPQRAKYLPPLDKRSIISSDTIKAFSVEQIADILQVNYQSAKQFVVDSG
jgi:hypothetical protein